LISFLACCGGGIAFGFEKYRYNKKEEQVFEHVKCAGFKARELLKQLEHSSSSENVISLSLG